MVNRKRKISSWISEKRCLPYRFRKSIIKKIDPSLLVDHPFSIEVDGIKYEGNAGNYIDRMVYFCGAYEKYMLTMLRDIIAKMPNDDLVFWDIGANVGNHSLFMSKLVKRVDAFEPFERVRKQFEKNKKSNSFDNINIHAYGLGNVSEELSFYAPPEGHLGNGSFVEDCNDGNKYLNKLQVKIGDEVAKELNIAKVDFIKMDVEGFERNVLEGLQETMKKSRPLVILEMSPTTRAAFKDFDGMKSLFPEDYEFLRYSKASRDMGHYKLAEFEFDKEYRRKDVIAYPKEMKQFL